MSAAARPELKDARRQFWWGEHELIDFGIISRIGTSAWAVYTCLLRHASLEGVAFPGVCLLQAETGLSNRVVATVDQNPERQRIDRCAAQGPSVECLQGAGCHAQHPCPGLGATHPESR